MKLKKSIVAIIAIVAVCALSLCVFVGCNNDDKDADVAATNNAETLGTAVAAAASYMGGATAGAAADEEATDFEEGINFEFDASASATGIGSILGNAIEQMKPIIESAMEPIVEQGVQAVQQLVGDKDVAVKTEESDKDGYNTKITITISDLNEDGEKVVLDEYILYMNIEDGKDIESKEFNYTAALTITVNEKEITLFSFDGTAAYDADLGSVAFNFSLGSGIAGVDFTASATKDGNVLLTVDADAFESFDASVSIEIGKLADDKYGATVTVEGSANVNALVAEVAANFKAVVSVSGAEAVEGEEYTFDLGGSVEIGASVTYNGTVYAFNGNATLDGQAKYNVEADDLTLGIKGTVAFDYSGTQAEK